MGNMERRDKSYTKENTEDFAWQSSDASSRPLPNYHARSRDDLLHRKREGTDLYNRAARSTDDYVGGPCWSAGVLLVVAASSATSRNHHQKCQRDQQQGKTVATPARRAQDENTGQRESAAG